MWVKKFLCGIIAILIFISGPMSSVSISQSNDGGSKKYFSIIHPTPGDTLYGTVKMYGTMRNDTIDVRIWFDKQFVGNATLDKTHNSWYFYFDTANLSNGFHQYRIVPLIPFGPDRFPVPDSKTYVMNPYPSLIEHPIWSQKSTQCVQHRDVMMSLSAPNLTNINMEGAMYLWDFGDGTENSGRNVTHSYSTVGNYTISLQVINDKHNIRLQQELTIIEEPRVHRTSTNYIGLITASSFICLVLILLLYSQIVFILKKKHFL